jgi:hypothetical protein
MFESILGGVLGLGGTALGARAASDAAQAQIDAGRDNREFDQRNLNQGMARYYAQLYGPQEAESMLRGSLGSDQFGKLFRDDAAKGRASRLSELDGIIKQYGTNSRAARAAGVDLAAARRERSQLQAAVKSDPTDALDQSDFRQMGPGILSQYSGLADQAEREGASNMQRYDRDSDLLTQQARGIEGMARNFGAGERSRINRDFNDTMASTNRLTESRMLARGLGASTLLSQQLGGNARQLERGRQDALGSLGDRQIGLQTQLAGNTMGVLGGRLGGRQALTMGNQDRVMGMRRGVIDTRAQAASGNIANPWLSRSTNYNPGTSPSAASGATWGAALSGIGGNILGQSLGGAFGGGGNSGSQPISRGPAPIDWSYSSGSTQRGSNRPR